jgi:hypothetical protein
MLIGDECVTLCTCERSLVGLVGSGGVTPFVCENRLDRKTDTSFIGGWGMSRSLEWSLDGVTGLRSLDGGEGESARREPGCANNVGEDIDAWRSDPTTPDPLDVVGSLFFPASFGLLIGGGGTADGVIDSRTARTFTSKRFSIFDLFGGSSGIAFCFPLESAAVIVTDSSTSGSSCLFLVAVRILCRMR